MALRVPLSELRDQRVSLRELALDPRERLTGTLEPMHAPTLVAATALQLVAAGPPDRAVQAATVALLNPAQRVDRLAESIGLSERQLSRRFLAAVGYGPKLLQRVLRLRQFQRIESSGLASAALTAGYADQAHLGRDCKALTGLSPRELRALSRPHDTTRA
jgi:AraC-like DNA-binding protein